MSFFPVHSPLSFRHIALADDNSLVIVFRDAQDSLLPLSPFETIDLLAGQMLRAIIKKTPDVGQTAPSDKAALDALNAQLQAGRIAQSLRLFKEAQAQALRLPQSYPLRSCRGLYGQSSQQLRKAAQLPAALGRSTLG